MSLSTTHHAIALVTGGSRGIGKRIVHHTAARRTDVILTYHSRKAEADALVADVERMGRRGAALQLDVGDASTFTAFAEQVQGVLRRWNTTQFHFLINNAGIGANTLIADTTEAQFDQLMIIHVKGPFFLTQTLLPRMADGGRSVNMSTALTRVTYSGNAVYASAKAVVEVLTNYLAAELGSRRITVNAIAPGAIATDFNDGLMLRDEMQALATSITALGRTGQADDVGGVVASLLAPDTGWVNGQRIEAPGGQNVYVDGSLALEYVNRGETQMSENNKAIFEAANAAVAEGNTERFLSFCADDMEWTIVGDKTIRGKEAIRQWAATWDGRRYLEPLTFTLATVIAEGEFVTVLGDLTMEDQDGTAAEYSGCDVWRFRGGKMVELRAFVIKTEAKPETSSAA